MYRVLLSFVLVSGLLAGGCRGPHYDQHEAVARSDAVEPLDMPAPSPAPPRTTKPTPRLPARTLRPSAAASEPVTPPPARSAGPTSAETWHPVSRWAKAQRWGPLQRISYSDDPVFELTTPGGALVFQIRNRQATWNGMQFHLGFAPVLISNEPCLHALDMSRTVEPLLLNAPWKAPAPGVIVLDPGHGGGVSGTRSVIDGSTEKGYTLDWALRLKPLLEQQGWSVLLTRSNDSPVALADRVAFAEAANADLFLSLHFNASGNGNHQMGLETYCLTPTGMPSTLTREFEDDASEVLPNNTHDVENVRLAFALHHSLLQVNGGLDRGVRRARFMTVLRGQNRPAVLIEGGYLSNPEEAARIADPTFRQDLAEAVARALQPQRSPAARNENDVRLATEAPRQQRH